MTATFRNSTDAASRRRGGPTESASSNSTTYAPLPPLPPTSDALESQPVAAEMNDIPVLFRLQDLAPPHHGRHTRKTDGAGRRGPARSAGNTASASAPASTAHESLFTSLATGGGADPVILPFGANERPGAVAGQRGSASQSAAVADEPHGATTSLSTSIAAPSPSVGAVGERSGRTQAGTSVGHAQPAASSNTSAQSGHAAQHAHAAHAATASEVGESSTWEEWKGLALQWLVVVAVAIGVMALFSWWRQNDKGPAPLKRERSTAPSSDDVDSTDTDMKLDMPLEPTPSPTRSKRGSAARGNASTTGSSGGSNVPLVVDHAQDADDASSQDSNEREPSGDESQPGLAEPPLLNGNTGQRGASRTRNQATADEGDAGLSLSPPTLIGPNETRSTARSGAPRPGAAPVAPDATNEPSAAPGGESESPYPRTDPAKFRFRDSGATETREARGPRPGESAADMSGSQSDDPANVARLQGSQPLNSRGTR
ncbi:MAG TPA: hypothetical protein PLV92_04685 [Pirellulaceae bacterium]|nr:hypothetical protein [Pirellulaceae bacterium]